MRIFDTLLGRTKPVQPDLDALFALPTAAVTLQVAAGLVPTGRAGVCFKAPAGQPFEASQAELEQLLQMGEPGATGAVATVHHTTDRYGYRWVVVESAQTDDLVTRVHMVHASLTEAGWGPQLLCSAFGFRHGTAAELGEGTETTMAADATNAGALYVVYLAKRGTFYPFAPTGPERRDTELELRIRGTLGKDLPVEADLDRWFPLWDLPIA